MAVTTRETPKGNVGAGKKEITSLTKAKPKPEGINTSGDKTAKSAEKLRLLKLKCRAVKGDIHYSGTTEEPEGEAWTPYPHLDRPNLTNQEP